MKKISLALVSTVACLFILAACTDATTPGTTSKTATQSTNSDEVKNDQNASLTIGEESNASSQEDQGKTPAINAPDETLSTQQEKENADQVAYNEALNTSNASACDKISSAEMKLKCQKDVQAKKDLDQAVTNSDYAKCETLTDPKAQILCQNKINESRSTAEVKGVTQE